MNINKPGATSLVEFDQTCSDHGFFLLEGHGLDETISETFEASKRFFDADRGVKDAIRRDRANPLGYNERELTKRRRDHKEVFDFVDPTEGLARQYNCWPDGIDGFREAMAAHYNECSDLAARTTEVVFAALGMSEQTAVAHRGDRRTSNMRLNQYTLDDPVPEGERDGLAELGDVALGHHTDLGLLTLLIQDDVGGLQAESKEHGWIDIEPRRGTIVVNLADCMQVWTNDRYRAAVHPMTRFCGRVASLLQLLWRALSRFTSAHVLASSTGSNTTSLSASSAARRFAPSRQNNVSLKSKCTASKPIRFLQSCCRRPRAPLEHPSFSVSGAALGWRFDREI